jgi:hypothetical protein
MNFNKPKKRTLEKVQADTADRKMREIQLIENSIVLKENQKKVNFDQNLIYTFQSKDGGDIVKFKKPKSKYINEDDELSLYINNIFIDKSEVGKMEKLSENYGIDLYQNIFVYSFDKFELSTEAISN